MNSPHVSTSDVFWRVGTRGLMTVNVEHRMMRDLVMHSVMIEMRLCWILGWIRMLLGEIFCVRVRGVSGGAYGANCFRAMMSEHLWTLKAWVMTVARAGGGELSGGRGVGSARDCVYAGGRHVSCGVPGPQLRAVAAVVAQRAAGPVKPAGPAVEVQGVAAAELFLSLGHVRRTLIVGTTTCRVHDRRGRREASRRLPGAA